MAPSQPITPLTFPLPTGTSSLLGDFLLTATVCEYANQSAIAPPMPGTRPTKPPIRPPRNPSHFQRHVSFIPSISYDTITPFVS